MMQCIGCQKKPSEISEYVFTAKLLGYSSAEEFVKEEEGTYDPVSEAFYCTDCYIKAGMPLNREWQLEYID